MNVAVLLGAGLLAAVVIVIALVRAGRRRRRDEIRSVHHYHDRLDTLHVDNHDRGGSVKLVHGASPPQYHDEPGRPRLDPDAANLPAWAPPPRRRERHHHHDEAWAMRRMQPRARIDTGTVLVVAIVVVVLVAIALAGYWIQRSRTTTTTTTTTTSTTTTTLPPTRLTASSVTGGLAVYVVAAPPYALTVAAPGGREWLQLTAPPLSANITTVVLQKGQRRTFTVDGPSDLELGAPSSAVVRIGTADVVLPASFTPPLTLRFSPG